MKTEFGILVAQAFSAPSDGERLLFQEIALDSGETLKLTDPAEMVADVSINNRVLLKTFATFPAGLGKRRQMVILHSDQDRIDNEDYFYGHRNDPMLSLPNYPF